MVAILEQPDIRRLVSPMSVETYHRLAELGPDVQPVELIRGVIIQKSDKMSRSQLHAFLVRAVYELLKSAATGLEMMVLKEDPLTLSDSEPEPDVSVVPGVPADYRHQHPSTALLVVEVAVTSLALDREKASLYAQANVPEYWIVLAERGEIEVYTALVDGRYTQRRTYAQGEMLPSVVLPSLRVELAALFAA